MRDLLIAFDFSSSRRSVALGRIVNDTTIQELEEQVFEGGAATPALQMVHSLLEKWGHKAEQVECMAVGLGPGSYTGIRAALSIAEGWKAGRGIRVIGIPSHELVVIQHDRSGGDAGPMTLALDAQRGDLYVARYELQNQVHVEVEPLKIVPVLEMKHRIANGERVYGIDVQRLLPECESRFPSAITLLHEAWKRRRTQDQQTVLEPIYLRDHSFVKAPGYSR